MLLRTGLEHFVFGLRSFCIRPPDKEHPNVSDTAGTQGAIARHAKLSTQHWSLLIVCKPSGVETDTGRLQGHMVYSNEHCVSYILAKTHISPSDFFI